MKTEINRILRKSTWIAGPTLAFALLALSARADDLVVNGSFEQTNLAHSSGFGTFYPGVVVNGWNTGGGGNALFFPGTADTTGATTFWVNPFRLWGPGDGAANGLPATSPDGGNFVALDGDQNASGYANRALTQTLNGLTPGETVEVTFDWAGAQWTGANGTSTDELDVSLGSEILSTDTLHNTNHGFTGWQEETFDFTATSTSEVLSFIANTTPAGGPAFVLLDGVSAKTVAPTPEPTGLALLGTGVMGLASLVRKQKRSSSSE